MSRTDLLVEDEPDLLLVARLMPEESGYAVIEARGGEEAVELAEEANACRFARNAEPPAKRLGKPASNRRSLRRY